MAITGINSENQNMRLVVEELEVNGLSFGGAPGGSIADLDLTGDYGDDDDSIEAAVNGILAALRANGIIASS